MGRDKIQHPLGLQVQEQLCSSQHRPHHLCQTFTQEPQLFLPEFLQPSTLNTPLRLKEGSFLALVQTGYENCLTKKGALVPRTSPTGEGTLRQADAAPEQCLAWLVYRSGTKAQPGTGARQHRACAGERRSSPHHISGGTCPACLKRSAEWMRVAHEVLGF